MFRQLHGSNRRKRRYDHLRSSANRPMSRFAVIIGSFIIAASIVDAICQPPAASVRWLGEDLGSGTMPGVITYAGIRFGRFVSGNFS